MDALAAFANETLNEGIDKALDDPEFITALRSPAPSFDKDNSLQSRLKELDHLRNEGLLTEDEYQSRRKVLLNES